MDEFTDLEYQELMAGYEQYLYEQWQEKIGKGK
jgi:hypothetical protein